MADNDDPRRKRPSSLFASYGIYGAAGLQLAVSTVAGLVFGNYLDRKLETGPWLAMIGTAAGFAAGMINMIRILKRFERDR